MKKIYIVVLLFIFSSISFADDPYWSDNNGVSSWGSCQSATPLSGSAACSVDTVNTNATAGDLIYFRAGTYSTKIRPSNSGSANNYITYKAYNSESVIITTSGDGADLSSRSYIIIDTLRFVNNGGSWVTFKPDGSYNIIKNCYFDGIDDDTGAYTGIDIDTGANYNKILNNEMHAVCDPNDIIQIWSSHHNLIEGNSMYYGPHNTIDLQDRIEGSTGYNIIRNNYMENKWHGVLNIISPEFILIENNIVVDGGDDAANNSCGTDRDRTMNRVEHKGIGIQAVNAIVRNNVSVNNGSGLSITSGDGSGSYPWKNPCGYDRVYNNTFVGNHSGVYRNDTKALVGASYFKNNIIYDNTDYGLNLYAPTDPNNIIYFQYNNILGGSERRDSDKYPLSNGLSVDPVFVNQSNREFDLQSNSPMINAGTWLTTTASSGNGTQVSVVDARYFTDGWGIIDGDTIQFEGQVVTYTIVNVNYNTNVLTLSQSATWSSGLGVALPYNGSSPDIGAFEYGGGSPPPSYSPEAIITSPTTEITYNTSASSVNLQGTATDQDGTIASASWSCSTCTPTSGNPTADDGTFDEASDPWTANSIGLAVGANEITVNITDNDGYTGSDTITVTRGSNTPPFVAIDDPTSSSTYSTTATTGTIGGTATDSDGTIASMSGSCTNCTPNPFTVTCDDETCDEASEDWTSETLTFSAGNNVVVVTATDDDSAIGTDTLTINQGQEEITEAESATETSPMTEGTEGSITYIYTPTDYDGDTTLNFSVSTTGDYKFVANVKASSGSHNSFLITVDSESQITWHINQEQDPSLWGVWYEDEINSAGSTNDPYIVNLTAGAHTIKIDGREDSTWLDWVRPVFMPNPPSNPKTTITDPTEYTAITVMNPVSIRAIVTDNGTVQKIHYSMDCAGNNYDIAATYFSTPDDGTYDESTEEGTIDLLTEFGGFLPEGDCTIQFWGEDNGSATGDADILTFTISKKNGGSGAGIR